MGAFDDLVPNSGASPGVGAFADLVPPPAKTRGMVSAFGAGMGSEATGYVRAGAHVTGLNSIEDWAKQKQAGFAPTPEEQSSIPLTAARSVGGFAADLPLIVGTAALLPEAAGVTAAGVGLAGAERVAAMNVARAELPTAVKVAKNLGAMAPVGVNSTVNTAADLQDQGVDSKTAWGAGIAAGLTTDALGATAMSMTGGVLKRVVSAGAFGLGASEAQRRSQNEILSQYPNQQTPFSTPAAVAQGVVTAMLGGIFGPRPLKTAIANAHTNAEADATAGEPLALPPPAPIEAAGQPPAQTDAQILQAKTADENAAQLYAARDAETARREGRPAFDLTPPTPDTSVLSGADQAGFTAMHAEQARRDQAAAAEAAGQKTLPFPVDLSGADLSHLHPENTALADALDTATKAAQVDKAYSVSEGGKTVLKAMESARAWNLKRAADQADAVEKGVELPTALPTRDALNGIAAAVKPDRASLPKQMLAQLWQGAKSADELAGKLRDKANELDAAGKQTTNAGILNAVADHLSPPKEVPSALQKSSAGGDVSPAGEGGENISQSSVGVRQGEQGAQVAEKAPVQGNATSEEITNVYGQKVARDQKLKYGKDFTPKPAVLESDLGENIPVDQAKNKSEIDALHAEAARLDSIGDHAGADATAHRAMLRIIEAGPEYQQHMQDELTNAAGDAFASRTREEATNPATHEQIHDEVSKLLGSKEAADRLLVHVKDPEKDIPERALKDLRAMEAKEGRSITVAFAYDGKIYVMDKMIEAGHERAVILHEAGVHLGMEKLIGKENFSKLVNQIREWANGNGHAEDIALAQKTMKSLTDNGVAPEQLEQETVAYFVQHAVEAGINPTGLEGQAKTGALAWMRRIWSAMKNALKKLGIDPASLRAQDIVDIAHAAAIAHAEGIPGEVGETTDFKTPSGMRSGKVDALYDNALQVVKETGRATIALMQRQYKIPYARAVGLIKAMEADGYITPESHVQGTYTPTDKINSVPSIMRSARAFNAQIGPEQALKARDAMVSKAFSMWDGVVKPALLATHLKWSSMNHIADITEHLIPHLETWAATVKNPIREKIDSLMSSAAMAKAFNHKTRQIADQMKALEPKQREALFSLMGKYQLAKVYPNLTLKEHTWLKPGDSHTYREARQLYDQPGVSEAYNAAREHNRYMHDAGMAAMLKSMAHVYGVPEEIWSKIDAVKGMGKEVQDLQKWVAASKDTDLQDHFKSAMDMHEAKKSESYFHIGRDGDYMVHFEVKDTPEAHAAVQKALSAASVADKIVVNPGDTKIFSKFETFNEMLAVKKQLDTLAAAGHLVGKDTEGRIDYFTYGKVVDKLKALDSSAPSFIRGMLAKIDEDVHLEAPEKAEQQELLRRLYIEMLPETSISKFYARRAGTPGYSSDMIRSFVKRGAAASYFVSQNATRAEQSSAMSRLREATAEMGRSGSKYSDPNKQVYATSVLNELNQRTANILTPLHTPVVDTMGALGNTFFLSASPSFIIQNLAQPYQLTFPYLGGRHGFRASAVAMGSAAKDVAAILKDTIGQGWKDNGWTGILDATIAINRSALGDTDKRAMSALIASGRADWTQGGELSRIQEGTSPHLDIALRSAGLMSYYGEALNRMQTGLAAFRLELKRTGDEAKAIDYMVKAVDDTQINYAPENRARAIGKHGIFGEVTPLVFAFQQFNMGVVQLLGKLTMQATSSSFSKEARIEAAKSLGGLLATTGISAGTLGLPFAGVIIGAYNAFMNSEDSPGDAKVDYQNFLSDIMGQDAAQVVSHGAVNYLSGADVASRLGQDSVLPFTQLFSQLMDSRMRLKDRINSGALQMLGPVVNGGAGVLEGLDKISNGETMKGLAQMSPSAFKGVIKGIDTSNNGFTDSKGVKLPMEDTTWDNVIQLANFTPTKLSMQREAQYGFNAIQGATRMRVQELENKFVDAVEAKDPEARMQVMAEIAAFRQANPRVAINLGGAIQRRAMQKSSAAVSGTGVETRISNLSTAKERTRFAEIQP